MVKKIEKFIEDVAKAPAEALDKTLVESKAFVKSVANQKPIRKADEYWHRLGPGLTTGAADDDPSGIATYSQTGAQYGFQLLWLAPVTFPLMATVQEMCARIGIVTGRGLAANIRLLFPGWVLYLCTGFLFIANTLNIGADLGAMAKATELVIPKIDFIYWLFFFSFLTILLQIYLTYEKYAKYLKWLALILLSYVLTALIIPNFDWLEVWRSTLKFSLSFNRDQIFLICGILGTTISPYLFFWQTSQEVEEEILQGKTTLKLRQSETTQEEITDMRIDVWSGMFLSNLVMFFIIAVSAATLNQAGITHITTSAQAAQSLKPLAGDQAFLLFALGVIGTGLLAVPVLAGSASYALAESFGWKTGLYRKLKAAYAFYGIIIISILIGLAINFSGINPFKVLIYSAVANGLVAPIVLILIVLISSNRKVMGARANHLITKVIAWALIVLMVIVGFSTIFMLLR